MSHIEPQQKASNNSKNRRSSNKNQVISPSETLPINCLQQDKAFVTQINQKSNEAQILQKYINNLRKQIQDTIWKQQLIIQYNYMPLQTIKQKIDIQRKSYEQKMSNFKQQYQKMFQNSQFTEQLENLRGFNQKLKQKMKQYEFKISQQNIKIQVSKKQTNQKRQQLKELVKHNMDLSKNYVEKLGATSKDDLIRLVKTKSQKLFKKRNSSQLETNYQSKLQTLRRSESAKLVKIILRKTLFEQCLDKLAMEIKNMKSSQDVQSGIYLQIMERRKNQYSKAGKLSHKSSISNTLHERYAPRIHKHQNKHYEQHDFTIQWDIFKDLNWKQLLGIIMVKDKNCQKLKSLFK